MAHISVACAELVSHASCFYCKSAKGRKILTTSRVSQLSIEIDCFLIRNLQITMLQLYIGLNWRAPSLLSAHVFPPSVHFLEDLLPKASSVSSGPENSHVLIEARNLWAPAPCIKIHLVANTIRHFLVSTKTPTTRALKAALRVCV